MTDHDDDAPTNLTTEERQVYERAARARAAIRDVLSGLPARDARARAVWRAAEDEASCIQLILEFEALKRAQAAAPPAPPPPPGRDDTPDGES